MGTQFRRRLLDRIRRWQLGILEVSKQNHIIKVEIISETIIHRTSEYVFVFFQIDASKLILKNYQAWIVTWLLWCFLCQSQISLSYALLKVQNSCIRFVTDAQKFDHISCNYHNLSWLKLNSLETTFVLSCVHHYQTQSTIQPILPPRCSHELPLQNATVQWSHCSICKKKSIGNKAFFSYSCQRLKRAVRWD